MQVSIIGAGGHAKVVYDALVHSGVQVLEFLDDDRALWGRRLFGVPITGPVRTIAELSTDGAIVAIGDNAARKRIYIWLKEQRIPMINAIHPTAVLAATVRTGEGVAVFANVAVNVDTVIGDNVILNTACTVDHDCNVGDHVHLGPGVHLCGEVAVGESTLLGVGAVAIPGIWIGAHVTVGAGAVVVNDLPDGVTACGVPARILRRNRAMAKKPISSEKDQTNA